MRYGRLTAVLVFILAALLMPTTVSAETISVSQDVRVRAVVLPMQYIVINQNKKIIEIGSNTYQAVAPQVYLDKISISSQTEMTEQVAEAYQQLVKRIVIKPGVLYKPNSLPMTYKAANIRQTPPKLSLRY